MTVVIALGVAAAIGLLAFALLFVFAKDEADVKERLNDYAEDAAVSARADGKVALAETKVVQDAVELTQRLAPAGLLERVARALEQAEVPIRPAEAVFFYFAGLFIAAIFGALLGGLALAVVLCALVAGLPVFLVVRRRSQRLRAFADVLPDTMQLLAGSLRAGFSLVQAVSAVAQEAAEPMRSQLQLAFNENQLGRPIEDGLDEVATRMENADLAWVVMAVRIQREVGGNLAELLDTIADTMVQRGRVRREIRALTAEGRLSALILGFLPLGMALLILLLRPTYLDPLFDEPVGVALLIFTLALNGVGFLWLSKILDIEV